MTCKQPSRTLKRPPQNLNNIQASSTNTTPKWTAPAEYRITVRTQLWMCSATYSKTSAGIRHRKFHDTATPNETVLLTTMLLQVAGKTHLHGYWPPENRTLERYCRIEGTSKPCEVLKFLEKFVRRQNFHRKTKPVLERENSHKFPYRAAHRNLSSSTMMTILPNLMKRPCSGEGRGRLENVSTVSYLWVESAAWSGVGVHADSGSLFVVCRGRQLSSSNRVTTC